MDWLKLLIYIYHFLKHKELADAIRTIKEFTIMGENNICIHFA
jgi:hypothetical protein